jgi:hypothetical protein
VLQLGGFTVGILKFYQVKPLNVQTVLHTTQTVHIFNVTQRDTQKRFPDDDVHMSKHVAAVECY